GSPPVAVRCVGKWSTTRERFGLAHELGHHVLHDAAIGHSDERERQADRFASAFLVPTSAFMREFPRSSVGLWSRLFALKARWGMSVSAFVQRATSLHLIA